MNEQIVGPDFLSFQVRDLEASRHFYAEVVGLKPAQRSPPGAIVFDTSPIPFAIRAAAANLAQESPLGRGLALWMQAQGVEGLHARLSSAGVSIVHGLADGPFGRSFTFSDPDGYLITLHEPSK